MTGGVTVGTLVGARGASNGLDLDLLAGASGLERRITLPYIQKTGLALAGFDEYLRSGRVLIFGESEIRFLERHGADERAQALRRLFTRDLPCVLITDGARGAGRTRRRGRARRGAAAAYRAVDADRDRAADHRARGSTGAARDRATACSSTSSVSACC